LQVIDSGIGITASALPKIFDPFEQAGQNGLGGLGLGLARKSHKFMGKTYR
jgi:signal transduction histidine kinase